jgi:hypothetical protein
MNMDVIDLDQEFTCSKSIGKNMLKHAVTINPDE